MDKVKLFMEKLGCTEEEAKELVKDDKRVDKGEKLNELTAEQKKNAKKYTQIGQKTVKSDKKTPKTRKQDAEKAEIIGKIADFLEKSVENLEIPNKEREISFKIGENEYSLTLTKHRKKKTGA